MKAQLRELEIIAQINIFNDSLGDLKCHMHVS